MQEVLAPPCDQHDRAEDWYPLPHEELGTQQPWVHVTLHRKSRKQLLSRLEARHERSLFKRQGYRYAPARRRKVLWLVQYPQAAPVSLEKTFQELAERWKRETRHVSSLTKTALHPAYQNIIGMGQAALPFIFRDLQENGGHWLWALHAITREDPARPEDDFDGAVRAWLGWGSTQGYLR
jgi:hypothetical protein